MRLSGLVLCAILIGCAYGASINNVRRRSLDLAASLKRLAEKRDLHPMPKAIDMSRQLAGRAVQKTISKRLADVNQARRSVSDTEAKSLHARAVENVRALGKKASTGSMTGKNIVARALDKVRATQKDFVRQPFQPAFMGFNRIARSLHNTAMKSAMAKLRK